MEARKPQDLIDRVKTKFELGGHKAAAIAMVLQKARVFLVSELHDDFVKNIFLEPYQDVQSAYNSAMQIMGEDAKVILIPHGGSILPVLGFGNYCKGIEECLCELEMIK
jgi:nickel-dependent lactate racemase